MDDILIKYSQLGDIFDFFSMGRYGSVAGAQNYFLESIGGSNYGIQGLRSCR